MGATGENQKSKSLIKSILIYLFLLYLAFVVSDLLLLKFVRPEFAVKLAAKDKVSAAVNEPETGGYSLSEIDSLDKYTGRILDRNIFNSGKMPPAIASLKEEPKEDELEDNDPVLTSLPLTLEGTAVHRNPFRSLATIKSNDKINSYTVGDEIPGQAEIISVIRKKVIFRNLNNKRLEYAEISRDQVQPTKVARKRAAPPTKKSAVVRSGNRFSAKRSDVNKYLNNLPSLMRQANSRPARDSATGELIGYQLFDIKPGIFQDLGLQNNDIITEVNGVKITNPAKAMSLFNQLKNASDINVTINRGGSTQDLEYSID